jgi:ribonuclease VapC
LESKSFVLDTNAFMAYLQEEPGQSRVRSLLQEAQEHACRVSMCVINLGEVMYILERRFGQARAQETLALIDRTEIEVVEATRSLVLAAAHIKSDCPISFADCFAAALAQLRNAVVVTGDKEFLKLRPECNVRVEWLGRDAK